MNNTIDVFTGEVKVAANNKILVSNAIGSCVAVIAVDVKHKVGGIAHVLLPGKSPDGGKHKTKYAADAIDKLYNEMLKKGAAVKMMKVFIVGGASILVLKGSSVGKANIESIIELLKKKGMLILARAVGGTKRRRVRLDIGNAAVSYSVGDGLMKILWKEGGRKDTGESK